jgi:hypothetical protein
MSKPKPDQLVTRDSLKQMLNESDETFRVRLVGRALVALFHRQTAAEQAVNQTEVSNGIGFSGCDARSGSLTARSFMRTGTLAPWQLKRWMKEGSSGYPRICKYAKQLNEIAIERRAIMQKQKAQQNDTQQAS